MLTLADVLELPVFRRALPEVIAGEEGLDRELRWAHVIEMADPSDLLKGGELVLTTGIGAGTRERDQARWIASLIEQGAAAVAVELGSTWRERVPEPVVRACADADVPLVAFRRSVRFIEITEAVHAAVLNSQFELLRARRGDPPPLHRADPARPRRARDPRRAGRGGRQPGGARGRRARARLLRLRPRRATTSRWARGPTCTAPRTAARRPRAR